MKSYIYASLFAAMLVPNVALAKNFNLKMSFGQDVQIASMKDVRLRAACIQGVPFVFNDIVRIYVETTASRAVLEGVDSRFGESAVGEGFLRPGADPEDRELLRHEAASGRHIYHNDASDGWVMSLDTMTGFKLVGDQAMVGLNTPVADCLISIEVGKIKRFMPVQ